MIQIRNAYVAMFDILGFKALRQRQGTAGIAQLYERSLLALIQHSAAGGGRSGVGPDGSPGWVPNVTEHSLTYKIMSDSVFFFAAGDRFEDFMSVVRSSHMLLQFGLSNGQTPFRGAIGHGDLYLSGEIALGSAIEDAYAQESRQLWAGAMFSDAAYAHALAQDQPEQFRRLYDDVADRSDSEKDAERIRRGRSLVRMYDVPIKPEGQSQRGAVIDWTIGMFTGAASKIATSEEANATMIRDNTITFETWARCQPI